MTWIQTHSGIAWSLLCPRASDVRLEDIAHSLAHICRFTGHTKAHYSVAQHSVLVARHVLYDAPNRPRPAVLPDWLGLAALLHDAHEAYLGDWSRPLKVAMRQVSESDPLRSLATRHDDAIAGWAWPNATAEEATSRFQHWTIRNADARLLATEARDLLGPPPNEWEDLPEPLPTHIEPWGATWAKKAFLEECRRLGLQGRP